MTCKHRYAEMMGASSTSVYYPPIIDRETGKNINPDKNIITKDFQCRDCGHRWSEKWQGGKKIETTEESE